MRKNPCSPKLNKPLAGRFQVRFTNQLKPRGQCHHGKDRDAFLPDSFQQYRRKLAPLARADPGDNDNSINTMQLIRTDPINLA